MSEQRRGQHLENEKRAPRARFLLLWRQNPAGMRSASCRAASVVQAFRVVVGTLKARMGKKMKPNKISPTPKPVDLPNALDKRRVSMMLITSTTSDPTTGIKLEK